MVVGWSWPLFVFATLAGVGFLYRQPGNADLPMLAAVLLLAAAFGTAIQSLIYWLLYSPSQDSPQPLVMTVFGARVENAGDGRLSIGRRWLQLFLGPFVLFKLAIVAAVVSWLQQRLQDPQIQDLGLSASDPCRVMAIVWAVQAAISVTPMPGTVGRQLLRTTLDLVVAPKDTFGRERTARKVEGFVAVSCLAIGMMRWSWELPLGYVPSWPFWVILGFMIWIGRQSGTYDSNVASEGETEAPLERWWFRRKLRHAHTGEFAEAIDLSKADSILEKVHREGTQSLTAMEQAVLRRVSERLRAERQKEVR